MSGKENPLNGNIPHIRNPEEHEEDDAESIGSENEEQREVEAQQVERPALDAGSRDSGLDSPLEFAIGGSLDSGHDSPLEGAVGGELQPYDVEITSQERSRIKPEKEDLFRKFFSKEYDQPNASVFGRREHPDQRQRPQESNINPLEFLQGARTPLESDSNKTGATIGQNIPTETAQGCQRLKTENLSIGTSEDLHLSVRRARNDLIDSRPSSDDSRRGLSPGSSSMSFSSRQTASTDNMQASPLLYSDSPEGDTAEAERVAQNKPVRQRRIGVVSHPIVVRSKSDVAGTSTQVPSDGRTEYHKKKVSEAMSVCSEPSRKMSEAMSVSSDPIPTRKISKDSSTDSPMSIEDESVNHPELSHSLESEPCLPMPDLDPEAIANFVALTVSSAVAEGDAQQNVRKETEESVSEQDAIVDDLTRSYDAESSHKPQND